jgi:hypothetical protein
MDVDDPILERFEKGWGVNPVVTGVDHELDSVFPEKSGHRRISIFGRAERLLRQLAERDARFAGERCASTGRPVGRDRDYVESALDEVA